MMIRLSDDRIIKSDDHQYMLCKRVNRKNRETGEPEVYFEPYKYHTTLAHLLKAVPEQMLKESDVVGMKACIEILDDTYNMIEQQFKTGDNL